MTINATDARKEFFDLVKSASEKRAVYRIQHRSGNVVMLAEEDYDNLIETLELLSIPGFRESIKRSVKQVKQGATVLFEDLFDDDE